MAEELAKDYSNYMDVGLKSELRVVQDTVDEMLTRLDEFENLISMIRTDGSTCIDDAVPKIVGCREHVDELCGRIDRLEQFVSRVEADMSHVEDAVEQATADLQGESSGRLKTLLKPLFFKSYSETTKKSSRQTPTCDVGEIFATEDFFPQNRESSLES